jgi:endonuclease YncB( thermonuclease family)
MMNKVFLLFLLLLSLSCNRNREKKDILNYHKVIKIVDGDNFEILINNKPQSIRLDAIDAPERGMPFYKVAKNYLGSLCFNKFVYISRKDIDRYGRWVSRVYLDDGTDLSVMMIKDGYAWHYKKYSSDTDLANLENNARNLKLGLWSDPTSLPPWEVKALHRKGFSTKHLFENSIK